MKFLPDQSYDCVQCGRSCQGWDVQVDLATRGRIRGSELELRVLQETGLETTLVGDRRVVMARRNDACIYLDGDNLCRIHGQMGAGAKPHGCRQFPFFLVETPEDTFVGLSFYCTAAHRNQGRPLEAHEADIEGLLRKVPARRVGFSPLTLEDGRELSWDDYLRLEETVRDGLSHDRPERVLSAAVWGACRAVNEGAPLEIDLAAADFIDRSAEMFDARLLCLCVLVASREAASVEEAWAMTEAIKNDEVVTLARTGWTGRRSEVDALTADLPPWIDDEIRRYLRALVFRKFLALDRPVLQNLLALYMLPPLLRTYSVFCSLARRAPLDREDYYRAVSETEKDLSHTLQGREGTWATFSQLYRKTVELLRPYLKP